MHRTRKIGNDVQCFFDDWIIEDMVGVKRRFQGFTKHSDNPVFKGEMPWESPAGPATACILHEEGRYKLYYEIPYETVEYDGIEKKRKRHECVCYAESEDGVHWMRPELNLYPEFGEGNNVVLQGKDQRINGMTIVTLPKASETSRYTALFKGKTAVHLAISQDGIHWEENEKPVIAYMNDTALTVLPLPGGKWRLYGRNSVYAGHWQRRIAIYESEDLHIWSEPETILMPEDNDEYYGLRPFPYGGFYVGLLMRFYSTTSSTLDCEWVFSRDGITWQHSGCTALPLGKIGSFDAYRAIYTSYLAIENEEIRTFYIGADGRHNAPLEEKHFALGMASMRREGFCWLDSSYTAYLAQRVQTAQQEDHKHVMDEGRMLTRPFLFEGDRLEINCDASGGRLDVAILNVRTQPQIRIDKDGFCLGAYEDPFEGLSIQQFDTVCSDRVTHIATWQGKSDLTAIRGEMVRLLFVMRGAKLYSFTVCKSEEEPQK